MRKWKWFGIALGVVLVTAAVAGVLYGKQMKMLVVSFKSFQNENLEHTFQHTPEI